MHAPQPQIIPPELLLLAYRSGVFPMSDARDDEEVFWVEPRFRAIIPLDGFRCSRSLAKVLRSDRFTVTMDRDFAAVIEACSRPRPDHPETWISHRIDASYRNLHRHGAAHSIEVWDSTDRGEKLVGGLYGVAFDRVFCGESMFSRADNASKVALAWLVVVLRRAGYRLLDCQFMTGHLASLGAVEIAREDYMALLEEACAAPPVISLHKAWRGLYAEDQVTGSAAAAGSVAGAAGAAGAERAGASAAGPSSSPGKLIAQSLTQIS